MQSGEQDLVPSTVTRIENRRDTLGASAYPFDLDARGGVLTCNVAQGSLGHAAYILSLILSNLRSVSLVLSGSRLHPDEREVSRLREFFQYFATAAMASEIQGSAWSFGFPRPDGTGFFDKLTQIWQTLDDGLVADNAERRGDRTTIRLMSSQLVGRRIGYRDSHSQRRRWPPGPMLARNR